MGIRLTLGADPGAVLGMVVAGSLRTVLLGAAVGAVGALLLGRLLSDMLYEVTPTDRTSFVAAVSLLVGVGVVASVVPGLRATRVDAVQAMKGGLGGDRAAVSPRAPLRW